MLCKSVRSNPKSLNTSFKISAVIALITVSMMGITAETPQKYLKRNHNEELHLTKPGKVTISRYKMTDPTTGLGMSVSKIHYQ
ncbi:hypothetical protein [Lyngbya sp. PCC 8106]|uniref:hypothetical protein n=1 Tax=Lyngbya sp. (strain PCC 8106) TaxID=313612 RepID=UPI0000EA9975|nr:hypothetical protein [Lyngbya sp. PCC 8106]EAW33277.1 hypothetical protein L8106_25190 [Lyngbya sp. PCC 8106]